MKTDITKTKPVKESFYKEDITKEEYLKALDIVEAYHFRITATSAKVINRETIDEFITNNYLSISQRLRNALKRMIYSGFVYMDEITIEKFLHCKGNGKKASSELEQIMWDKGLIV